jgi:hypothetical protein
MRRESDAKGAVVEPCKMKRSGAETNPKTTTAHRLGDGELSGEEEGVAQRGVDHLHRDSDALGTGRHRDQQGWSVPCHHVAGRRGYVVEARDEFETGFLGSHP